MLTALRAILREAAKSLGVERAANAALIEEMWPEVIGTAAAAHCRLRGLRGTVVLAEAEAGPWAQELSARRGQYMAAINRCLGGRVVTDIRFVQLAPLPPAVGPAASARAGGEPGTDSVGSEGLSPAEMEAVERAVAEIGDLEIRAGARRAMISQLKWRKGRTEPGERA